MLYFFFVLKFTVPFSILSHMFCPNIYKRFVDLVYDRFLVKFPAGLLIVGQCFPIELGIITEMIGKHPTPRLSILISMVKSP